MNNFSASICQQLAQEILKHVQEHGSISFRKGFADGSWEVLVDKNEITLGGYAGENMTQYLVDAGCKVLSREKYDWESTFSNPAQVLSHFSMTALAEIYEAAQWELQNKHKFKNR